MQGKELIKLAADFSAGTASAALIRETYGPGVLASVAALAAGGITGVLTDAALNTVDEHTGLLTGAGSMIDNLFGW